MGTGNEKSKEVINFVKGVVETVIIYETELTGNVNIDEEMDLTFEVLYKTKETCEVIFKYNLIKIKPYYEHDTGYHYDSEEIATESQMKFDLRDIKVSIENTAKALEEIQDTFNEIRNKY